MTEKDEGKSSGLASWPIAVNFLRFFDIEYVDHIFPNLSRKRIGDDVRGWPLDSRLNSLVL